jgi:outer membrane receptor protein involved in Fe transport
VDDSISGSANTWTAGLRWSPVSDLQFRGNKTSSIRDPAITELFLPTSNSFTFASDPCDENFINLGTAPATRKANCAAAGITQPFTSNIVNATAPDTVSGNPNLQPEHADSRTVGFVLRPRWTPKLDLTMDYIDIRLTNAIESLTATQILDACYDSTDYPNNPSCKLFTRNSAGQITMVHTGYVNAGYLRFTGLASALNWVVDVPTFGHAEAGSLGSLEFRASHLDTMRLVSKVGAASQNNNAGEIGTSKSKGQLNMTYRKGPFYWYWQGVFIGNAAFSNVNTPTTQNYWGVANWWLINSTLGYQVAENTRLRLVVNNVFDKEPPYPALAGSGGNFAGATSQYFSGIIGRAFTLSVDMHF